MLIASGFSWFHLLPGGETAMHGHGYVLYAAWFVFAVVTAFGLVARASLAQVQQRDGLERYHADETLTARTAAELVVGAIVSMMSGLLEKADVKRFIPLVGTLAIYIFLGNILAILPGFQPPTDNINTNVGMAICVLLAYWAVGLTRGGSDFVGHIFGPVLALAPLIGAIELLGLLIVRPFTLTLRLTANIFGDHTVYNIMSGLVPVIVPVPFLGLAMVVSLIQAFVFALLTTIYLSQSLPHGHHDDDAHH